MKENNNVILRVKDLRISFRTLSGKVQAVRNVSFNLQKGETLAVVGESGSGKSVTTRAAMGILAKNAIVESGEILYDGKDILQLSEWELHKIRGEKISMIFQDPLSSLNPIVRIGKQLTEAPVLKARSKRKESRLELKAIHQSLKQSITEGNLLEEEKETRLFCLDEYLKAMKKASSMALPYEYASFFLNALIEDIEEALFALEHKLDEDLSLTILEIIKLTKKSFHPFLLEKDNEIQKILFRLEKKLYPLLLKRRLKKGRKEDFLLFEEELNALKIKAKLAYRKEEPDFFLLSLKKGGLIEKEALKKSDELKEEILLLLKDASLFSYEKSKKATLKATQILEKEREVLNKKELAKKDLILLLKNTVKEVKETIDPLSLSKDSYAFTYEASMKKAISAYFKTLRINKKEEKRYEKESRKWNALKEKGKEPSFKVAPANIIKEETLRGNILKIVDSLLESFQNEERREEDPAELLKHIDHLEMASKRKHTSFMAKIVAIRLMKEVGIAEPRKRFRQYPFEFSGGMRQRIVIAIALTNDPEILICDEPTTALDVTIQAQILELINRIKKERELSVIFITHNLGVVANMADKIAVMYAGEIVEYGTYNDIFYDPKHPYTWALLSSMPDLETKEKLDAIPGTPPNMIYPPKGDAFADRNKYALKIDFRKEPPMFMVSPTHFARTWLLAEEAPEVIPPKIVLERILRMEEKYGEDIDREMKEELLLEPDEAFFRGSQKAAPKKAKRRDPIRMIGKGETNHE